MRARRWSNQVQCYLQRFHSKVEPFCIYFPTVNTLTVDGFCFIFLVLAEATHGSYLMPEGGGIGRGGGDVAISGESLLTLPFN